MAFIESGTTDDEPSLRTAAPSTGGLAYDWPLLRFEQCPRCSEPLTLFEHIDLWKCVCGFKISGAIMRASRSTGFTALSRGYCLGDYHHETPF